MFWNEDDEICSVAETVRELKLTSVHVTKVKPGQRHSMKQQLNDDSAAMETVH